MYYMNLFPWKNIPNRLYLTEIRPLHDNIDFSDESKFIIYKHVATLAKRLSTLEKTIASKGAYLILESNVDEIKVSVDLFISGMLLKNVGSEIINTEEICFNSTNMEYFRNFLNRKLDHLMEEEGYLQNKRFYWKPDREHIKKLDNKFNVKRGIVARTLVFPDGAAYLLADYQTHYYSKLTIWDVIKNIMDKRKVSSYNELDPISLGFLRNKATEAKYRIWKTYGYWEYESVRIHSIDLTKSVAKTKLEGKDITILEYHKKAGRKIEPEDQPVLTVRRGKFLLTQVPSLLREIPSMENLKRYNQRTSTVAARISRLDPASRFFEIEDSLLFLLDKAIINYPKAVQVSTFIPQITMNNDFIEIKKDNDFRQFYSKGKLTKIPNWKSIHIFYDIRQIAELDDFIKELKKIISKFKLKITWVKHEFESSLKLNREPFFRDFKEYILNESKNLNNTDLVIWAIDGHNKQFYNDIKFKLTVQKDVSTQQILINSIKTALDNDSLKFGYVNPLFPQLVVKMGGLPYLFQAGITMNNTIFIGLDRYRDPKKEKPSITAAAASFSDHGEYLGASSTKFDALATDDFLDLDKILSELFNDFKKRDIEFSNVILLRDGRIHSIEEEVNTVFDTLEKYSLKGAFITANKSSNLRIFKGDSLDNIEEIPEQYIAIHDYYDQKSIVISSTQPIISHGHSLGTARPMLYTIEKTNITNSIDQIKGDLARAITAFTRLNWTSFKGNRLPAPLSFAHNLAGFCSDLEVKWRTDLKRPTYL